MGVPENIDALLATFDITQDQLARIAGVTPGAVTGWKKGSTPRENALDKICAHFNIERDDILSDRFGLGSRDRARPSPQINGALPATGMPEGYAPKLGRVHAGVLAEPENLRERGEMVAIPRFLLDQDPACFVLNSEGDCMDKVLPQGSDLVVSPNKEPQDTSIVVASVDGCDAIVRRMRRTASTLILSPESHNPAHKDLIITGDSDHTVELIGVVVWFQASGEIG